MNQAGTLPRRLRPGVTVLFLAVGAFLPVPTGALHDAEDVHTVVAVIDTGVRLTGFDTAVLRNPLLAAHPSTYVTGYPGDAESLDLTLHDAQGNNAQTGRTYWVPESRVIAARGQGEFDNPLQCPASPSKRPIYDDCEHGTNVARLVALQDPDALLAIVEVGNRFEGIKWAAEQPWIDIITMSLGTLANLPTSDIYELTQQATQAGKIVTVAAGNGLSNTGLAPDRSLTYTSEYAGPSWVVTVGVVEPTSQWDYYWHSVPVDVVAPQTATSYATPIVAGQFARVLAGARAAVGDSGEGPRGGALVVASPGATLPSQGPLSDGALNRTELEAAVLGTARPTPLGSFPAGSNPCNTFGGPSQNCEQIRTLYELLRKCVRDGSSSEGSAHCSMGTGTGVDLVPAWDTLPGGPALRTQPPTPVDFVFEGYGIVNSTHSDAALRVVLGLDPAPERPLEDAFLAASDSVRDAIWAPSGPGNPASVLCLLENPVYYCCPDPEGRPEICLP